MITIAKTSQVQDISKKTVPKYKIDILIHSERNFYVKKKKIGL